MKIKQLIFSLIILFNVTCLASLEQPDGNKFPPTLQGPPGPMPKVGTPEFDEMMAQQMTALQEILNDLTPSEQDALLSTLAGIGEGLIKEAEDNGFDDPFEFIAKKFGDQEMIDRSEPTEASLPYETPHKSVPVAHGEHTVESVQRLLGDLAKHIASLRRKSATTPSLAAKLDPFKYRLDDLVYFLELFKANYLATYLTTKEFSTLTEQIEMLEKTLSDLDYRLNVSEFSLEGEDDYAMLNVSSHPTRQEIVDAYHLLMAQHDPIRIRTKMSQEGASIDAIKEATSAAQKKVDAIHSAYTRLSHQQENVQVVEAMLDALGKATEKDGIIDGFKSILKKREPKLLAERQELEKSEAEARKRQETLLSSRVRPGTRDIEAPPYSNPYAGSSSWRSSGSEGGGFAPSRFPTASERSATPRSGLTVKKPSKPGGKGGGGAGKDKEKDKDKDKGKPGDKDKDKGKATTATDKKGKPAPIIDKDVFRQIGKIDAIISDLKDIIKENNKKISGFPLYLGDPLHLAALVGAAQDTEKAKFLEYQKIFDELSKKFKEIPSVVKKSLEGFKDKKKEADYQTELNKIWDAFTSTKSKEFDPLRRMLSLMVPIDAEGKGTLAWTERQGERDVAVQKQVDPSKRFVFFGAVPQGMDLAADNNKWLAELNPLKNDEEPRKNYPATLFESINAAQKAMMKSVNNNPPAPQNQPAQPAEQPIEPAGE